MTRVGPIHHETSLVNAEIDALTAHIGRYVRDARQQASMSRRELSERSGVSQRYLAQIEAGDGNISIALLVKLGRALDLPVTSFLADFVVEPHEEHDTNLQRLAVIGLRGAGKSTLGKRIGQTLGLPFVELNDLIEQESGLSTSDVIAMYGPEGYRAFEHRALEQVLESHDQIVLAVAGGIVGAGETFELLLDNFKTIWLQASPDEHISRVRSQGDERPMAGNPKAMDELKSILASRESHYARADAVLDTSGRTPDQSEQELTKLVRTLGL